jgi:hypothetical protein
MAQEHSQIPAALKQPYPVAVGLADLGAWIQSVEQTAQTAIVEARTQRNGNAVARLLWHLDQARSHGYRELERLGKANL